MVWDVFESVFETVSRCVWNFIETCRYCFETARYMFETVLELIETYLKLCCWNVFGTVLKCWVVLSHVWNLFVNWVRNWVRLFWNVFEKCWHVWPCLKLVETCLQLVWNEMKLCETCLRPLFVFSWGGTCLRRVFNLFEKCWDSVEFLFETCWDSVEILLKVVEILLKRILNFVWDLLKLLWNV